MSHGTTTITPLATYRNETPYPFCPGCGHGPILDRLNEALVALALDPKQVIVVMGDGGLGIGGAHLLAAARRNVGIKVLVFNNFNFGMTGGQHSATTPAGAITATTPEGALERPLDACATVAANGASPRRTRARRCCHAGCSSRASRPGSTAASGWWWRARRAVGWAPRHGSWPAPPSSPGCGRRSAATTR